MSNNRSTPQNQHHGYAEKYLLAQKRNAHSLTALAAFEKTVGFPLDEFQLAACRSIESGRAALVAAPTGAGKTIVGEFGVFLALRTGLKAFYTTPIKALSNQKYRDLVREYGEDAVGLLTGDTSINTEAPILVMTTEVLRNMLYANSTTLEGLGYVIMDEVHYLADRFRGAVWEEAIIHLPEHVTVISLSATVSNVEEFGAWLDTVRGGTDIIVSEHRPVPLWQHVMVGNRIVDLFTPDPEDTRHENQVPTKKKLKKSSQQPTAPEGMRLNPQLKQLRPGIRRTPRGDRGYRGSGGKRDRFRRGRGNRPYERTQEPGIRPLHTEDPEALRPRRITRPEMVRSLDKSGLLPAICFIFSRAGCDGAVTQCLDADLVLTTEKQQQTIRLYIAEATAHLDTRDLNTLGYYEWRDGLIRGIAAHHAGMLPLFKETVEILFAQGLIKVVFATETLALGINMPARTVILEKLTKYNGETHVDITPGEYTQLTGRAGRRGIDIEGHAVITWRPGLVPDQVAALASTRTYPLNSSFRPTYNMATNLIAAYGAEHTRKILESSFAQYQADKSVVGIASRVRKNENALQGYQQSMRCHLGDFSEYFALQRELTAFEKKAEKINQHHARTQARLSIQELLPGDIIYIPTGRSRGYALVTTRTESNTDPRLGILTEDAHTRTTTSRDFDGIIEPVSRLKLPKRLSLKTPKERRDTASRMRQAIADHIPPRETGHCTFTTIPNVEEQNINQLHSTLRTHPCHGCSDRQIHIRWAQRWYKLNAETEGLRRQIAHRTNTIAQVFNRITHLLSDYGYVTHTQNGELTLTSKGQSLRRIYGEKDLLTSLCLEAGFLNNLKPAAIAATIAALTYQGKRDSLEHLTHYPHPSLREPITTISRELTHLNAAEEKHKLEQTPSCDFGLVEPIYLWARGAHLAKAIENTDLSAGDFVRWAKQVIDALDQITHTDATIPELRTRCTKAISLIRRGVVALDT